MKTSQNTNERYTTEQRFHDIAFSDDQLRASAVKYYNILDNAKAYYYSCLRQHVAPGTTVLEYGCGPYTATAALRAEVRSVVGIDLSTVAIRRYMDRATAKGLRMVRGCVMNAESLAFSTGAFDLIYGSSILHHLDLDRSLSEISRTLKPGGTAVFLEPLGHNPAINLYRRLTPSMRTPDEHPFRVSDFEVIRKYFGRIELKYFNMASIAAMLFRNSRALQPVLRSLNAVDEKLFEALPFLRRYAWCTVMTFHDPVRKAAE
jgi:SAM-dependent methyltransferase